MHRPNDPPNQSQLVCLITALLLLSVGLLLSHAVWSPGAHATTECAVCLFLQDSADPDLDWRIATIRQNIGDCLVRLDQWDEAHAMLLTVLETRTAHGSGRARARTEKVLARLALARGDTPAARRHIDSAAARHDGELPAGHPSLREEHPGVLEQPALASPARPGFICPTQERFEHER